MVRLFSGIFDTFTKHFNMPQEYKPALREEEYHRIDELMKELQATQAKEDKLKRELRKLIYKTEYPR